MAIWRYILDTRWRLCLSISSCIFCCDCKSSNWKPITMDSYTINGSDDTTWFMFNGKLLTVTMVHTTWRYTSHGERDGGFVPLSFCSERFFFNFLRFYWTARTITLELFLKTREGYVQNSFPFRREIKTII